MDESLVGSTCAPFEIRIELGKIREFARATRSRSASYFETDDPHSPPTFLASASFWMDEANNPALLADLDMRRVLNGSQEFTFHGPPPRAGDRLTGQGRIDRVYRKEGRRGGDMTFMEIVYEYRDASGKLVADVRSTVIQTGNAVDAGAGPR